MLDSSERRVIEKCERFLRTARAALDNGDPESAASRAYYALHHMTVLLLYRVKSIERDSWSHRQLYQAFLDEFCKLHFRFSRSDGDDWGFVRDIRLLADYSSTPLSIRRARTSVEKSERLVDRMRQEVERDAN
jgi:uncharacterized protein (UPF0332 family)